MRKAAGFEFTGTEPEFTGYSTEVEMADPDAMQLGRHYTPTGMYTYSRPGTIAMVDFDGGAFHRTTPPTVEHVQEALRRISGTNVALTGLLYATTWTDRAFQASAYRRGRVLLAGDAAHIHSPLGGQGLKLGIGDAMNLGWKLASTIRGDAPAGGLLMDFDSRSSLQAVADRWGGQITFVASDVKDRLGLSAVLVRPDGFVASASAEDPDSEEVSRVVATKVRSTSRRIGSQEKWTSIPTCPHTSRQVSSDTAPVETLRDRQTLRTPTDRLPSRAGTRRSHPCVSGVPVSPYPRTDRALSRP